MGGIPTRFHLFLSHVWGTGQDQMRIVKQRLVEMLPDIRVFLDVDDLKEGKGAEYVDASGLTLIFVSDGYFTSPNCLRELLRAAVTEEADPCALRRRRRAARRAQRARSSRSSSSCARRDASTGHVGAQRRRQELGLRHAECRTLRESLFLHEPIEWNRIGAFQDVTMRLMAEALLPTESLQRRQGTFLQGELVRQPRSRAAQHAAVPRLLQPLQRRARPR